MSTICMHVVHDIHSSDTAFHHRCGVSFGESDNLRRRECKKFQLSGYLQHHIKGLVAVSCQVGCHRREDSAGTVILAAIRNFYREYRSLGDFLIFTRGGMHSNAIDRLAFGLLLTSHSVARYVPLLQTLGEIFFSASAELGLTNFHFLRR
jgi:hypothetical protein